MMNCEKASELISKKQEMPLSFWEKIGLKFHQSMCKVCRLFEEEVKTMNQSFKQQENSSLNALEKDELKAFLEKNQETL